ncbi:hypothetical protein CEE45_13900 [Candidatus Heimdallarchaeota archaeon B3_Heim]|nr:MAG: hypothetical protein CEE45_13900 [Candidatus Heimdallarchaeota archaeon B3_Heim]
MRVYIIRFTFPRNVFELCMDFEKNFNNLAMILEEKDLGDSHGNLLEANYSDLEFIQLEQQLGGTGIWTLPKSVLQGDILLFQYSLGSRRRFLQVKKELYIKGLDQKYDWASLQLFEYSGIIEQAREYVIAQEEIVLKHCGKYLASAVVTGSSFYYVDDYVQQGGRIFASYGQVHLFENPLSVVGPTSLVKELPEFASHGPVSFRVFKSQKNLDFLLECLRKTNNTLPDYLTGIDLSPSLMGTKITKHNWLDLLPTLRGFLYEDQMRFMFTDFFLKALADGKVFTEKTVVKPRSKGIVDYIIQIGDILIPIEIKLNIQTEADFLEQILKYTGPAKIQLTNSESISLEHSVVVAIDQNGVYFLKGGHFDGCSSSLPILPISEITPQSILQLRRKIKDILNFPK